mmetsp:Transcript_32875/g.81871  ORF Transcript_32875/g.81871 Transcript_32875/m.81871 type:complete len:543 (+) Transcript_32875:219-1847(+)
MASAVLGNALDDFVGAVLAKKSDKGFLEQVDREFLDTEIRALKEKLKEYERASLAMGSNNSDLQLQLVRQKDDQKDIFQYLNGELAKKTDEIVALEERLLKLEEENDRQIREHEQKSLAAKDAAEQDVARLQEQITAYKEQLEKVNTFIELKSTLETQLAEKKRALEDEAKEHATHVSDLERKHVQEKDRLKKEMLIKLRETKANLLKMTDNQLDTTTKRTIAENEQMSSELAWQSKETEKLIRKNDKLIQENQSLKRELALHKQTQEEFAKKVHVYQKTIKTLLAKLNSLDATQQQELQKLHYDEEEKEREKAENQQRIEALEEESQALRAQLMQNQYEMEQQHGMYQDLETKHMQMLSLQDESVKFTLQCLKDMREQFANEADRRQGETGESEAASERAEEVVEALTLQALDPAKREQVLSYLLEQLQAYQQQLRELELNRQWQQHSVAQERAKLPPIPPGQPPDGGRYGEGFDGMTGRFPGSEAQEMMGPVFAEQAIMSVNGPVRPWGKRAKELPLTRHTPSSYQRSRQGYGGRAGGLR